MLKEFIITTLRPTDMMKISWWELAAAARQLNRMLDASMMSMTRLKEMQSGTSSDCNTDATESN